jgi:hypothetical protein
MPGLFAFGRSVQVLANASVLRHALLPTVQPVGRRCRTDGAADSSSLRTGSQAWP